MDFVGIPSACPQKAVLCDGDSEDGGDTVQRWVQVTQLGARWGPLGSDTELSLRTEPELAVGMGKR